VFVVVAEDWDEFPNGRWGDSRSPAYGDLDGYPVKIDVPVSLSCLGLILHVNRVLMWFDRPGKRRVGIVGRT
jgi:hypothetical protein